MSSVICPGSFDPPTYGHINIIERALTAFKKVIVAIAVNRSKSAFFTAEERVDMMEYLLRDRKSQVEIVYFEGLLVNYCRDRGIKTIVRGIRTVSDYEYELQMSLANRKICPEIDTLFMMTEGRYSYISSSIIKEVIKLGGSGTDMIDPYIEDKIKAKLTLKK